MALSHIVMQVALCNAALRLRPGNAIPVHVVVTDRIQRDVIDQTFREIRENGNTVAFDFDIPWGEYRAKLQSNVGRTICGATQYFSVLPDHTRTLDVSLHSKKTPQVVPTLVMGAAPFAFAYLQPTVVAFDKSVRCNGPVGDPIDAGIVTQNDADGYYAQVFPSNSLAQHQPIVIAVRLTDSHGDYHYIRVSKKFAADSSGWPTTGQFDINENAIDFVADKPEDTLLCPRLYETTTH